MYPNCLLASSGPERVRAHDETRGGYPRREAFAHARCFPEQSSQTGPVRIHQLRGFHLDVRAGADEQQDRDEEGLGGEGVGGVSVCGRDSAVLRVRVRR